ncbi:MAG TPA: DUF1015 domain-containing protein [Acidimicrobiales bacterium]|nr:DUF1015 domain-containing protein [Acidimicrobiales bacterium]
MPRFEPFAAVRYAADRVALGDVVAPPYDVVGPEERAALEARSPYNVVHVDLGRDGGEAGPYEAARGRMEEWLASGVLRRDPEPGFYAYRMGWRTPAGEARQTSGVMGLLALDGGAGEVLPHERTMAKPLGDRLQQLRTCRANVSAIWALSLAEGLGALSAADGPPLARCTDDDGVHHRLWRVTAPALVEAIRSTVAAAPVVIADGHHRYETALAYRAEQAGPGPHDYLLAYVTGLADGDLGVGAIHRLLSGLPPGFSPVEQLAGHFEPEPAGHPAEAVAEWGPASGGPLLVVGEQAWRLPPRPGAGDGAWADSERLEEAMRGFPHHDLAFTSDVASALALVEKGEAQAAVLVRPVGVDGIAAAARAGRRLPEKTTYFFPKPRTGVVIRSLD